MSDLKRTPLYEAHVALGAKIVPFAGFEMPVQYPTGITREHEAVRSAAGMFDVSHMGEFLVEGPGALATMHRVVVPEGRFAERRLTMPFFHNANWDARVECIVAAGEEPRHEPVLAGAHLMEKFRSTVTPPPS